jgi:hypothetical protein
MAKGRSVDAKSLTNFDNLILSLCEEISKILKNFIQDEQEKKSFFEEYGKISRTRDAGMGRSGGKLQRDALCTRGNTIKAPISNRNFRWHPLVLCRNDLPNFPLENYVDRIELMNNNTIIFVFRDNNHETRFSPKKVYKLKKRYFITSNKWVELSERLAKWDQNLWTNNSCCILAQEACEWYDAIETYATLGMSILVLKYKVSYSEVRKAIVEFLQNQKVDLTVSLPTVNFPKEEEDLTKDPLSLIPLKQGIERFRQNGRPEVWIPPWSTNRREQGEDSSIQMIHLNPLIETQMRHNASNVRYGFRWSNLIMQDHTIEETYQYLNEILLNKKQRKEEPK